MCGGDIDCVCRRNCGVRSCCVIGNGCFSCHCRRCKGVSWVRVGGGGGDLKKHQSGTRKIHDATGRKRTHRDC
jgi:hypothetical protein